MAQGISPPDESKTIGVRVPSVTLTDAGGAPFDLEDLAGKPVILNPVFTRCPHVCPAITSTLRDAALRAGDPGVDYHVVTVSFDPDDTIEDLAAYRDRLDLPDGWRLAIGPGGAVDSLLSALDFRYEELGERAFAHPNVVAILTPQLVVSGYVRGIMYEADDLRRALARASGVSLVDRSKPFLAAVAIAGVLVVLVVLRVTRNRGAA